MKSIIHRFFQYVTINTQSSEDSNQTPTTTGQMTLAIRLKEEAERLGLTEVTLDENGYLFATLPANITKEVPTIGFIAHLDTSPDMSGEGVNPRIVEHYDGGDILLNEKENIILSPREFPELLLHCGEDLIVTDGTTLLGADDKAGIAEIMTAMEHLLQHPEIGHGKIRIGFNPDEEIGVGAHKFNIEQFGCDWAYTIDGGECGELEYENFNAATATITVNGRNVHPGYAKGKMINAIKVAAEVVESLSQRESPEQTEGYEGFYHPISINGGVDKATLAIIIRDHNRELFEEKKRRLTNIVEQIGPKYGNNVLELQINDSYYNMREKIEPVKHVVETAQEAMRQVGIVPNIIPIRGGTDGSYLSYHGLPCPNLFAGGINFHSRYEFVPVQTMEKAAMLIAKIAENVAKQF